MADLNDILRFRCSRELKARFMRIAKEDRRDPSDLGRIMLEDYCTQQERELKLSPITPREVALFAPAEEQPATPPSPRIRQQKPTRRSN